MSYSPSAWGLEAPELAPDLDWMLADGQLERGVLARALVEACYRPLHRLGLLLLDDLDEAAAAAVETLVAALAQAYRYPGDLPAQVWVFRLGLERIERAGRRLRAQRALGQVFPFLRQTSTRRTGPAGDGEAAALWRAVDALDREERLPLLLQAVLGWSAAEAGLLLGIDPAEFETRLKAAERIGALGHAAGEPEAPLAERLARAGAQRWPEPALTGADLDLLAAEIEQEARARSGRQGRRARWGEAATVLAAALLVSGLVWGLNAAFPEPDPTEAAGDRSPAIVIVTRLAPRQPTARVITPLARWQPGAQAAALAGETLVDLAGRLGVAPPALARFNRLPETAELRAEQALLLPPPDLPTPEPVTPAAAPEPLTLASSSDEIRSRLAQRHQLWRTLWADGLVIQYGPPGYAGDPEVYRVQAWKPDDRLAALILIGAQEGDPEEAWLYRDTGSLFLARPHPGWLAPFQSSYDTGYSPRSQQLRTRISPPLRVLGIPSGGQDSYEGATFRAVGLEAAAGREALVVYRFDAAGRREARLWLDPVRGAVLRQQQFGGPNLDTLVWELRLEAATFDAGIPPELLDPQLPWRGGFAADVTGVPEPAEAAHARPALGPALGHERRAPAAPPHARPALGPALGHERRAPAAPPPGFDPARSWLTFQFPAGFDPDVRNLAPTDVLVDVFAGEYFLGRVDFPPAWDVFCARSPDGRRVAVSRTWRVPGWRKTYFQLFDLQDRVGSQKVNLGDAAVAFAFSPDGRQLAVYRYGEPEGEILILDLETSAPRRLLTVQWASSLVWSPDGEFLALLAALPGSGNFQELVVVRAADGGPSTASDGGPSTASDGGPSTASDGEVVYRQEVDASVELDLTGSPVAEWGVPFPVEMGGLEQCAAPPGR